MVLLLCFSYPSVIQAYQVTDSFGKHWFDQPPERVIVTDWALLEQLLELGVEPIGAPELDGYRAYVHQPSLPESITDIGLRMSPKLEVVEGLKPDLVILGTDQKEFARPFSRFTRVMYYKSFSERYRGNGEKSRQRFLEIAELFQKQEQAEAKLQYMDERIGALKEELHRHFAGALPKVTPIRFSSQKKCLIYGANSLPDYALSLLGIETDYPLEVSKWGESEERLSKLQRIDEGYLFYFLPTEFFREISTSSLWQSLPVVKQNRVRALPPTWSYGGAMSVLYLAEAIAETLLDIAPNYGSN